MNHATRVTATVLAVYVALSAMVHGYREVQFGNTPTRGVLLPSVGAFSLIPNYLATGMATILVSLAVIVWTVGFIDRRDGPLVLLILFAVLFFVGGGVAQVVVSALAWAMSTRIGKPLIWWRRILPDGVRRVLARYWSHVFIAPISPVD